MALVAALKEVGSRRPASPALKWRQARWAYGDLLEAVAAVETALRARELPSGARIAVLMRNSPQYVACYYGVLGERCAVVPLNPHERAVALARQVEHSGATLLVGDQAHPEWGALCAALESRPIETLPVPVTDADDALEIFTGALADSAGLKLRRADGARVDSAASPAGEAGGADVAAQELATIIYTSGTTGSPKGVMLSHGNLKANTEAIIRYLGLTAVDRTLCVLPFQFAYGNSVLHSHLLAGAELVLEDNFAFPHETLKRMRDESVTGFAGVPSTFSLLLGRCRLSDFDLRLRYVTQAGGPMPVALQARLREELPETQVFIMYGQTEATARLTYLPPDRLQDKPGSVGIPVDGVELDVFDEEGRPAAPNEIGEVCARGPNVMLGYWNDPAATAKALRGGWLRTGDLGWRDEEGFLFIQGRAVEMIKTGAFRVAPQEVEEVIAAVEGVEEVAVTAVADDILGQAVKAVVIPKSGAELTELAVKAHCRAQLAAYKVPKVVEFVAALPRTASGKVQRRHL